MFLSWDGNSNFFSDYENLILNMSSGLLPEHLLQCEVNILKSKHGENWFEELGYTEPEYKMPKFS